MAKAVETAYSVIRSGIVSGEFARGDRLREAELAERIGVSRTPIREALRRLDSEGLVDFVPNRGASVTAWSERELDDLYEARALLESYVAKLAAARITAEQLTALRELAAEMNVLAGEGPGGPAADRLTELNGEFHLTITRAGGNAQIEVLIRGFIDVPLVHRTFRQYAPERLRASMFHHDELIAALAAGDGEWAESVMRSHILAARTTVHSLGMSEDR
ncbi:GntR family transcriptional regulator [Actinomadura sp. DC4]|uniref:GntR family transcriptional regulator n=1 Tax=Actinomadura sp. DC4 TaxID=3055069 RepID=UPI0025AF4CA9|nr:GntR family transcriptional regulator [Actinomadura sp. DC4]MDN3359625.1 GntR family transcriptional regulator [Actinomadura sp. DC4]